MFPLLTVLNDLSWVIECAAMDHMGEGKSELGMLSKRLTVDPAYAVEDREEIAEELEAARAAYMSGDRRAGAHKLMMISRRLWKRAAAVAPAPVHPTDADRA